MSELSDWQHRPETWLGMKVDATLVDDHTRHKGEIVLVSSLTVNGEVLSENYPTIRLDDGRMVGGLECWWTKDVAELP